MVITALIVIIVFIVVAIFLAYTIFDSTKEKQPTTDIVQLTGEVALGYRCGNSSLTCAPGLACDSVSQTCKKIAGKPCNNASECLNGSYCSGVCIVEQPAIVTGKVDDPCPCLTTMACVPKLGALPQEQCKLKGGQDCTTNEVCKSDQCVAGKCTDGREIAVSCRQDSECKAGLHCSKGYCQPLGVETGATGAGCNKNLVCNTGNSCLSGFCVKTTAGLDERCNTVNRACILPLICSNFSNNGPCTSPDSANCRCTFPYSLAGVTWEITPKSCAVTEVCGGEMKCENGNCKVASTKPCNAAIDCISGKCSNTAAGIFKISFTSHTTTTSNPFNSLGSIGILTSLVSKPTGDVTRLFGAKNGTPYYVTYGSKSNPTSTGILNFSGQNIVPGYKLLDSYTTGTGIFKFTFLLELFTKTAAMSQTFLMFIVYTQATTVTDIYGNATTSTMTVLYQRFENNGAVLLQQIGNQAGQQFYNGTPIDIFDIDVNDAGDIMLIDPNENIYILPSGNLTNPVWVKSPVKSFQARFYNTIRVTGINTYDNIAYSDPATPGYLKFNGVIKGATYPNDQSFAGVPYTDYSIYSIDGEDISSKGYMVMLKEDTNRNFFMVVGGIQIILPGNFYSSGNRCLALGDSVYVYSPSTCS